MSTKRNPIRSATRQEVKLWATGAIATKTEQMPDNTTREVWQRFAGEGECEEHIEGAEHITFCLTRIREGAYQLIGVRDNNNK
jgi:hypothetical protein